MTRRLSSGRRLLALVLAVGASTFVSACRQDMHDAPKLEPLEQSTFFKDHRASRPLMPGTIARGQLREDTLLFAGKDGDAISTRFPFPVTEGVLERGRERFNIYCTPCHSRVGDGNGMIVQRGYKKPPSFHEERLRGMPPGYYVQVMANGFGVMPSYALQVKAEDRWAITAYIKALQLSHHANVSDLTAEERVKLDQPPVEAQPAHGGGHGAATGHGSGDGHGSEHGKEATHGE